MSPTPAAIRRVRRLQGLALALLSAPLPGLDIGMPLSWAAIALAVVTGLKLLEARRSGELRLASLLLLMVCGVQAALLPGLGPSLLQASGALLALAALLLLEVGAGLRARQLLGQSLRLVAAALPLVLVLFLLVPRLGPIWDMPFGQTARTGLSDTMDPGSISRLVATNQPAARLSFTGSALPAPAERYWRVLTLEVFDGRRWSRPEAGIGAQEPAGSTPPPVPAGAGVEQLWLVEPSALPFLPWSGRCGSAPTARSSTIVRRSNGAAVPSRQPQHSLPGRASLPTPGAAAFPLAPTPAWRSSEGLGRAGPDAGTAAGGGGTMVPLAAVRLHHRTGPPAGDRRPRRLPVRHPQRVLRALRLFPSRP